MLDVVRKTLVKTKETASVHEFRSDWKPIYRISYDESKKLFASVSDKGFIETEPEFAYYILNKFGEGIYYFRVYKKGQKGFRDFLYIEVQKNRFRRLKAMGRYQEKRVQELKLDIETFNSKIRESSGEERDDLEFDLENAKEELEEIHTTKKTKYPYPYLTSSVPVYSWHGMEEQSEEEDDEKYQRLI
jgi:hypothetical protein